MDIRLQLVLLPALLAAAMLVSPGAHSQALPEWDQLTPAQREQLIAPIRDRWNDKPEHRQEILAHAERWQALSPEERRSAHRGLNRWKNMSPEQREQSRALYARMHALDAEGRKALKQQWRQMTAEERRAWVLANPAPARPADD